MPVLGTTRSIVDVVFEHGGVLMTHDIDDLLEMIRALEERIIELEKNLGHTQVIQPSDSYYWNHG